MTYINRYCADAGTVNCPCPLAETGDCLICGRLSGKGTCDCHWAGLCIYNEYVQNGGMVRNSRQDIPVKILEKNWYGEDLLVLTLDIPRGMALNAARPGSFVFLRAEDAGPFASTPVSVMLSDAEKGQLYVALKIISGKTKQIAEAEGTLLLRGIYRNGLLGGGLESLEEERKTAPYRQERRKWLIMTKGAGFAPAVNLLRWMDGRMDAQLVIDTEKIGEEMVRDYLHECMPEGGEPIKVSLEPLQSILKEDAWKQAIPQYDKVFILASDHYIKTMVQSLAIPDCKLIFSNNFHMCCGEGICGACGHTDADGHLSKMCKCRQLDIKEMR